MLVVNNNNNNNNNIDHLIQARRPDLVLINKRKKKTCQLADHKVKIKESQKLDKYLDLAREL